MANASLRVGTSTPFSSRAVITSSVAPSNACSLMRAPRCVFTRSRPRQGSGPAAPARKNSGGRRSTPREVLAPLEAGLAQRVGRVMPHRVCRDPRDALAAARAFARGSAAYRIGRRACSTAGGASPDTFSKVDGPLDSRPGCRMTFAVSAAIVAARAGALELAEKHERPCAYCADVVTHPHPTPGRRPSPGPAGGRAPQFVCCRRCAMRHACRRTGRNQLSARGSGGAPRVQRIERGGGRPAR